jgi:DNA-binding NarL/FixJ family response regulator
MPTILTVDDHDVLRTALKSWILLNYPDTQILEARTGEEALVVVAAHEPDIVLMDISLPRMNGIEATGQIKALDPLVQLVILTANDVSTYRREAAAAGASAYVLKDRIALELAPVLDRRLDGSKEDTAELVRPTCRGGRMTVEQND